MWWHLNDSPPTVLRQSLDTITTPPQTHDKLTTNSRQSHDKLTVDSRHCHDKDTIGSPQIHHTTTTTTRQIHLPPTTPSPMSPPQHSLYGPAIFPLFPPI